MEIVLAYVVSLALGAPPRRPGNEVHLQDYRPSRTPPRAPLGRARASAVLLLSRVY